MNPSTSPEIRKKVFILVPATILMIGLMLFVPAGSFSFWQAWVFMGTLFIPFFFVVAYFMKRDPELLKRRLQFKEKEIEQKSIIRVAIILFIIGFLVPGLDFRYGWSNVPVWLVTVANLVIFISYMVIFLAFRENSYASRIIVVEKGQKVISTGPYAIVRHPMYTGVIPMYLGVPIALGSYFALIFFLPVIIIIVLRILNEEKVLLRDLEGYKEYMEKVKYRLIPGIW